MALELSCHIDQAQLQRGENVCGKFGDDEVESMRNMMSMGVFYVLSDIFNIDVEGIDPESELQNDLGMTELTQKDIDIAIANTFDNFHLDFSRIKNVRDIVNQVVQAKMGEI